MYDEPFTGQDPISMGVVVSADQAAQSALAATSLLVSHDIHETCGIADKIYIIDGGKVSGRGRLDSSKPTTLRDSPVHHRFPGWPGAVPLPGRRAAYRSARETSA